MLTDNQIKKLIDLEKLKIEPFDGKNLKASRYDIHLGRYILKPKNVIEVMDLSDPRIQPEYEKIDISEDDFMLNPGDFVLGQTLEMLELDSDIGIFIDGSTTPARLGITIHQSATFVPPGQDSHIITLEIFNAGPWKVKLPYNLRIGKLIFFKTSEKNKISTKAHNRYNGQKETTGAIIQKNNES